MYNISQLIVMFANLWKGTINFAVSVYLSDWMEPLGSHWMDFHEILYPTIFLKIFQENSSFIKIWQD